VLGRFTLHNRRGSDFVERKNENSATRIGTHFQKPQKGNMEGTMTAGVARSGRALVVMAVKA